MNPLALMCLSTTTMCAISAIAYKLCGGSTASTSDSKAQYCMTGAGIINCIVCLVTIYMLATASSGARPSN